jgi:tetratricopeptide (TPR) repeat protein
VYYRKKSTDMCIKNIYTILFSLFLCTSLAAQDSLYYKANDLYGEGRYEEAAESYEKLLVAGKESAALYYNLGNSYFRSNKLGKARLYFEKALKLNPGDEDSEANLKYLLELLPDRFDEVPVIFYKKWISSAIAALSSNQWAYISIVTFVLALLAVLSYLFFKNISFRKAGFFSFLGLIFISMISFAASWKQYKLIRSPESAIITDLMVNAKSAPHESGTGLFVLHEGAKVYLEDKTGGWQEIRLTDGRKGWVPVESLESI